MITTLDIEWWEYLRLSDTLHLTVCCKDLHDTVFPRLLQWLSAHICSCSWRRIPNNPQTSVVIIEKPSLVLSSFALMKDVVFLDQKGRYYAPKRPAETAVWRQVRTQLCRECLRPTGRKARTKNGNIVMVCKACAFDLASSSSMCSRRDVRDLVQRSGGDKRVPYNALVRSLHVCKIGGNRAILYWRADVEEAVRNFHPEARN